MMTAATAPCWCVGTHGERGGVRGCVFVWGALGVGRACAGVHGNRAAWRQPRVTPSPHPARAARQVRLAWHAAGTYDKGSGTGGSNGATMRYAPESEHGANAGLAVARALLEPIKAKVRAPRAHRSRSAPGHEPRPAPWSDATMPHAPRGTGGRQRACARALHPAPAPPCAHSSPGSATPTCGRWPARPPSSTWAVRGARRPPAPPLGA